MILHEILSKDEGVIYASSSIDPKRPVFDKPYSKTSNTN